MYPTIFVGLKVNKSVIPKNITAKTPGLTILPKLGNTLISYVLAPVLGIATIGPKHISISAV